jgi:hypothetical protein
MKVETKKLLSTRKEEEKIQNSKEVSEETIQELELPRSHKLYKKIEGARYGTQERSRVYPE